MAATPSEFFRADEGINKVDGDDHGKSATKDKVKDHESALLKPVAEFGIESADYKQAKAKQKHCDIGC